MWILSAGLGLCGCREPAPAVVQIDAARRPTEVLKDFMMTDVKSGVTTMTLQAKEGRIYESRHIADVDAPLVVFYKLGKESSRLTAPLGRLQTETHDVDCWGGVTVVSADSSTLTTERLHYDPKIQRIFSNEPVRLEKPDSVTDGIGLETDPELKSVKIGRQKVHFKKRRS